MAELSAPVLQYRGLSQEEFRGFVLRNEMIEALNPLGRVRSRFIRAADWPTTRTSPQFVSVTAHASAASAILLSAANDLGVFSAAGVSGADAPIGTGALYPAASSVAVAAVALGAPSLLGPAAASASTAIVNISVAPFASSLSPTAGAISAATLPLRGPGALGPTAGAASAAALPVRGPAPFSPTARSASGALLPVIIGHSHRPYVFDAVVIVDSQDFQVAEIARSFGPLELGYIDDLGDWNPAADPVALMLDGFAINAAGLPYYDTHAVDPGEEADLFIDPVGGQLWLAQ